MELTPEEIRVLGCLVEKERTTPDQYPLSTNALRLACNQKTNREPVVQLTETDVVEALDRLRQDVLVWRTEGARTERWQQSVVRRWGLDRAGKALMTLLLLRGPQTPGELRTRSERMHPFASLEEVEEALRRMAGIDEPLVMELPRRPGQKETRWTHLVGEGVLAAVTPEPEELMPPLQDIGDPSAPPRPSLTTRVEKLEEVVARLTEELEELKKQLGA